MLWALLLLLICLRSILKYLIFLIVFIEYKKQLIHIYNFTYNPFLHKMFKKTCQNHTHFVSKYIVINLF